MDKDYKIEVKPSLWVVVLATGCYSDAEENYLFVHANNEEEVWNFLCRYYDDIKKGEQWGRRALVWNELRHIAINAEDKNDIDWDTAYGDAEEVTISRMKVIEFKQ